MNIHELEHKLIEAGCSGMNYSISDRSSDVYCLMNIEGVWKIFYTERGHDQESFFESTSEEEACEFFFNYQTEKIQHVHLVGFFKSKERSDALDAQLKSHGLQTWQNHIPHFDASGPRYRIFVVGRDIFRAKEILGAVPLED